MSIITQESLFDYNMLEAIKRFKNQMGTDSTGEELQEEMWENKSIFGEIMLEITQETLGDEIFE